MAHRTFFAACTLGLEPVLAQELRELDALHVMEKRGGVSFRGDLRTAYEANLWIRSGVRVQEELLREHVEDGEELYAACRQVPWNRFITPEQTLAVYASVRDTPGLRHSGYAALRVKDAIVDTVRESQGSRPSVDTKNPDLPVKLVVKNRSLKLYRDLTGTSLHKRGYRPIQVKSPLNEATAAGLLLLAGYDGTAPLVDPMCGSGTFPIEAAMIAADRAPGLGRSFAFESWPDLDAELWDDLRMEARDRARTSTDAPILAADWHAGALDLARQGARTAGVENLIAFAVSDVADLVPDFAPGIVVANPPYGERLGEGEDLIESWRSLGRFLKQRCGGATAWLLSGNKEVTRHLGMRTSLRVPVMNGPIECRWLKYEIHARDAR